MKKLIILTLVILLAGAFICLVVFFVRMAEFKKATFIVPLNEKINVPVQGFEMEAIRTGNCKKTTILLFITNQDTTGPSLYEKNLVDYFKLKHCIYSVKDTGRQAFGLPVYPKLLIVNLSERLIKQVEYGMIDYKKIKL